MYVFCLVLSVIAAALGLFALGIGFSPREGSLGNALLIVGAVGIVGGMIMFGLATVVRQLRQVAEALGSRPAAPVVRRPMTPEAVDMVPASTPSQRQPAGPRAPFSPRPGADQRGPAAPPPPPLPEAPDGPAPSDRQRPPMMEEEVPLAPSRAPAPHTIRGGPPLTEPPLAPERPPEPPPRPPEPRPATQADIIARLSNLASAPPRPVQRPEPPRVPPPPPPPPPVERATPVERTASAEQRRANMFDSVWPAEVRAARQSETIARVSRPESRPDARSEPRPDIRPELRSEQRPEQRPEQRADLRPEQRFEPPPRDRIASTANGAAREPMMPPPAEPRPIAILKSGVIDGMAYTLYTDGSIEAELPQGTMRFASIDDLRSHLEKADRQA